MAEGGGVIVPIGSACQWVDRRDTRAEMKASPATRHRIGLFANSATVIASVNTTW